MLKKLLIKKVQSGSIVQIEAKDLTSKMHVVRLKAGDDIIAKVIWNNGMAKVEVPECDFKEVAEVDDLSKNAMRIIREVQSYL